MSLIGRLPLFSFLLSEFGASSFSQLAAPLSNPALEEPSLDEASRFYHELVALVPPGAAVDSALLRDYDAAIGRHTERIGQRRPQGIRWRYFQYLMLLFTERFLDRLFSDQDLLLADLNEHLNQFNRERTRGRPVPAYERADLRKLAIWSATGSGKTLVMHVNLLQVLDHYERAGRRSDLNRVLLLTPNEGLSRQHRDELELSGIEAEIFAKDAGSLFRGRQVEIIDIHKLRDVEGEKSVAIDAFGDDNLVLVDEGHRGAGGEHWMEARERLCNSGFSLEYSATFGQAFAGRKELEDRYAKWIAFEYSYRHFYADGYGKDFRILNFPSADHANRHAYLRGALLSFYQQQRCFADLAPAMKRFQVERPLWAFVGSSVTARVVRTENKRKVSDVVEILEAFARFLSHREETVQGFEDLLAGGGGILDARQANVFADAFPYLEELGIDGEELYEDLLRRFFNTESPGPLRVVRLRGIEGELALQVGDHPPFGVVNVGDAPALHKLCAEHEASLFPDETDAETSLFDGVNKSDSTVNLVVGAKKFVEGWSSWRVSSLGLLRVGRGEGPQIVQLFGRGVRLRGYDLSLKRSSRVVPEPPGRPEHIGLLETLTVFGVRANYMATFREQLELEGIAADRHTISIPVTVSENLGGLRLIRPEPGADFVQAGARLGLVPADQVRSRAVVNWYSRISTLASEEIDEREEAEVLNEVDLTPTQTAFFDTGSAYRELVRFKGERGWSNLVIDEHEIVILLARHDWYQLFVPPELVAVETFEDVERWQQIVMALLCAWCERRMKDAAAVWLQPRLHYAPLEEGDPNLIGEHLVSVPAESTDLEDVFTRIAVDSAAGGAEVSSYTLGGTIEALNLSEHLYRPLLYVDGEEDAIVKPTPLNYGENRFLRDVNAWCHGHGRLLLQDRRLFLLRNQTRGRGVGFFEAENFYPDFILWLLDESVQRIVFVDPKGIVRATGVDSPKIALAKTIKGLEARLGDPSIRLSSFIVSVTPFNDIPWWTGERQELEKHHVVFMHDDPGGYVEKLVLAALADTNASAVKQG